MEPKDFPEVNVRIAESQEQYETLPAYHNGLEGSVTFCMQFDAEELQKIAETGQVWFKLWIGNQSFPPLSLSTKKEDLLVLAPEKPSMEDLPGVIILRAGYRKNRNCAYDGSRR